ncbi:MAG TPA: histidine phosphatase family protein [Acidimicrobiales bacterium]|nr:histidine phosphatase family protein [Acidimicrobiales bacterium]
MSNSTFHIGSEGRHVDVQTSPRPSRGVPQREGESSCRIYLVRHGRTPLNAQGLLRGRLNPELDITGLHQAMALGDVLGRIGLGRIVSSPLRRAVDTASPIAERAERVVAVDRRLIDRDYGRWAGHAEQEVVAKWGSLDNAPDIEPLSDVRDRALSMVNDTAETVGTGSAVLVTHDAIIRALLPQLDPRLEGPGPPHVDPGSFSVVENLGSTWWVRSVNNVPFGHESGSVLAPDFRE